ncbi:GNAT family N-acetyltransferase [Frondihabitans cladoniiphilus]|uniref:GNAT family N-acetyltransferase n=1 Tax=Frondihabitans cladoniiphilus TaxID=715785 RepID=A0ABP8VYK9_9MICO
MSTLPPLHDRVTAPAAVELPESRQGVTWRPITTDDAAAVHALRRVTGLIDHPHYVVTLGEIEHELTSAEIDLERDTILGEDARGDVVAYGTATLQAGQATLVKSLLDGAVHPALRGLGIGTQIVEWQEARGRQQLASSDKRLPGWLTSFADEGATPAIELFQRHGYGLVRWWLELSRDLSEPIPSLPLDPALRLEVYGPEWSERTREARNESFRDHWGSQPMPQATWDAHGRLPIARPDLSVVAVDPATEQVVGFVLTDVNEEEWAQLGHSFGYVAYVGVLREYRGRKIAQALLSHTLQAYREQGFERAVLDVDSESPTGATGLYAGLGFVPVNRSVSIVKEF